jgi:CheY-like chemotaxis protein
LNACRRILVIESNPDAGAALCALLETWGHNAIFAETGRQGIRETLHGTPDVMILDLGLRDMDGCEVVRLIRAEPGGDRPVMIAYSGSPHREAQALDAGCDVFILKPNVEEMELLVGKTREEVRKFVETAGPAMTRPR